MATISYPSKILLFGEYTVTNGSGALAIPFFGHSGHWIQQAGTVDFTLLDFQEYLASTLSKQLKTEQMYVDLQDGWRFLSTIPQGYGLGSSGALVAAVFDRYQQKSIEDLASLKELLAKMESFFHGKSSGIDPMVSYLKEPVLISPKGIEKVGIPPFFNIQIFLLDSFTPRNTEHWVQHFQTKKTSSDGFKQAIDLLGEINESIMASYMEGDEDAFWKDGKALSHHQFIHFREFIPESHQNIWENSLLKDDYFLKICGAGGGGFTLGFTKKMEDVLFDIKPFNPLWIY